MYKFLKLIIKKTCENELMLMSNALTFKLLLSIFPFIIFLMTLMGFFNIGITNYIQNINKFFPIPIQEILNTFLIEVLQTKRISLLSTSFLISVYSASTGFNSIIQALNKAYGIEDKRSFIKKRFISVMLVFIFAFLLIISLLLFVFSDFIKELIFKYTSLKFIPFFLDSLFLYIFIAITLFFIVLVIYKISIYKFLSFFEMLPGILFSISGWLILSKLFNIYINNFSKYSKVYGSIGGIFVLVLWLNMISFILLLGGQINAVLNMYKHKIICVEKNINV